MNRAEKKQQIEEIHGNLSRAGSVFLVDMTGLKVNEVTDLRRRIRAASGGCRVVKNRLAARAAAGTPAEVLGRRFKGPIGVVTHSSDPITVAKVLTDFGRDHPNLQVRAAALSGRLAEAKDVAVLASLPGFEELRAKLLGVLTAPACQLVRLLATPGAQLVRVLDAHHRQAGES